MAARLSVLLCVILVLATPGCRSARYRVRSYYKYPSRPPPASVSIPPAVSTAAVATSSTPAKSEAQAASGMRIETKEEKSTTFGEKKGIFGIWSQRSSKLAATRAEEKRAAAADNMKTSDGTVGAAVYRLRPGDPVYVYLRGIPGAPGGEQQLENIVGEDGTISLPFIDKVKVADLTATEAQDLIRQTYLDKEIYKQISVNVVIPARSYYIRGEVRQPGRYPLVGTITIMQAIAAAGGYTEFASRAVEILRGDKRIELNMRQIEKRPELDQIVEPGDVIIVQRSIF